jgi:uncharacterized surface protein with fasciclin (FAS1) repeats
MRKLIAGVALATLALTAIAPMTATAAGGKNVVERAVQVNNATGIFDTLIAAVLCTPGIADALATTPDITVFAPTDGAFGRIGLNKGNVCSALDDAARADVLTYHVIDPALGLGKVSYREAVALSPTSVRMLNGDTAELKGGWLNLRIDGASSEPSRILLPNVPASNGVIHVVSNVLLP